STSTTHELLIGHTRISNNNGIRSAFTIPGIRTVGSGLNGNISTPVPVFTNPCSLDVIEIILVCILTHPSKAGVANTEVEISSITLGMVVTSCAVSIMRFCWTAIDDSTPINTLILTIVSIRRPYTRAVATLKDNHLIATRAVEAIDRHVPTSLTIVI